MIVCAIKNKNKLSTSWTKPIFSTEFNNQQQVVMCQTSSMTFKVFSINIPSHSLQPNSPLTHHPLELLHSQTKAMNTKSPIFFLLFLFSISAAVAAARTSTLQVFHILSTSNTPFSWSNNNVVEMQAKDQSRIQFLSSLVARKSFVPIASGRSVLQSPTYVVRAKIGTPAQTLLLALDTSNDVAWIPCSGCVGCPSTTVFSSDKSSSFHPLPCQASQCNQVNYHLLLLHFFFYLESMRWFLSCSIHVYIFIEMG